MRWRQVTGWLALLLVVAAAGAVALRFAPSRLEPRHAGRPLGVWLRGHPRAYTPAVLAVGTNALPYLLAELRCRDPFWLRGAEEGVRRLGLGPPWEQARTRRYHARLALQILDTNAVPALLTAVFARPMALADGDRGYEAAFALTWMASPAAQRAVQERIAAALGDPVAATRRNACLAVAAGNFRGDGVAASVAALTRDPVPAVRAAATRAALFRNLDDAIILPAVVERLTDDHAALRRLAADALAGWGTNAVSAVAALQTAWTTEPSRPRGTDRLDDVLDAHPQTPERVREALRAALQTVAPGSKPSGRGAGAG